MAGGGNRKAAHGITSFKLLRKAGIVGSERHGVWAYYYVNKDSLEALRDHADKFLDGLG